MKSVPAEFAATFLALNSFLEGAPSGQQSSVLTIGGFVMLIILPFYQWKVRHVTSLGQHIASALAFVIWGLNISGSAVLGNLEWYSPYYAGGLLILWAVVAPILTVQRADDDK